MVVASPATFILFLFFSSFFLFIYLFIYFYFFLNYLFIYFCFISLVLLPHQLKYMPTFSSVASPLSQEGQSERTFPIFAFSSRFLPDSPLFPDF